jgi:pimeloyl-ACP methyl ester carboxylesterase
MVRKAAASERLCLIAATISCFVAVTLATSDRLRAGDDRSGTPDRFAQGRTEAHDAPHRAVRRYEIGVGPRSYWLFEPDQPKPEQAPVVVFLHGWFAVNPGFYGAWIDHLVRHGQIVIFPRYQNDVGTLPQDFLPNALAAVRDGLGALTAGVDHVRPNTTRFALIGHSAGGNLAAQIAAVASDPHSEIPSPRALCVVMPGEVIPSRQPSLDRILGSSLLLVIVGEDDLVVGDLRARQIFTEATSIPRARRRFVLFRSDRHGYPPLIADHTAPTGVNHRLDNGEGVFRSLQKSLGDVNALDRAGFWRMTDVTLEAAFEGKTFDDVTRDLERFRHLGYWSDGRRVIPPIVSDDLSEVPRVILGNGLRIFPFSAPSKPSVALDPGRRP